ncbi:SDR family oxidoreductase [Gordonia amarae]|uniref:SDR family oxidoreductase n=1 Tax=Gordonia amarae TaxID=36821 RepID=UPI001AF72543|nr:SDR family oxidoreductase [Gordonia amarae]QHN19444.1 SDR family oxidoreductase [Gordonia amarae]QHN23920.1 SDR family oxidoreductase [Gordonia amarae]
MDLGISGRWAIVCASSSGLGLACAEALAAEGVNVVLNGRDGDRLAAAADRIRQTGASGTVIQVQADLLFPAATDALLAACPEPDIVVTNNAGPRPARLRDVTAQDWQRGIEGNLLNHLRLIDRVTDDMCERKFGRIVNITSAMVTAPKPIMAVSSAVRTGLTSVVKALSMELAPYNVTINNVLPERVDTGRMKQISELEAERQGISYEEARAFVASDIAARRFGRPEEVGAACAFLCGSLSGYISGQNLHVDGGTHPSLF